MVAVATTALDLDDGAPRHARYEACEGERKHTSRFSGDGVPVGSTVTQRFHRFAI